MTDKNELRIEIWDDDPEKSAQWLANLDKLAHGVTFDLAAPSLNELKAKLRRLEERRKQSRRGVAPQYDDPAIDNIDVLFLDYDLLDLSEDGYFLTGNEIAYLARSFSRVGYIVVLNQFGIDQFDLSMLRDFRSKGDLDIGDSQIANCGLWTQPLPDFRPWHWPLLPQEVKHQRLREEQVLQALESERPILRFLGFEDSESGRLDPAALSYLTGRKSKSKSNGGDPFDMTFREFVFESGNGLERRDAEALASTQDTEALVASVAAARIHKWLDRVVLGGQDLLIDGPHLTERLPGVLTGDRGDIEQWNRTVSFDAARLIDVLDPKLENYQFEQACWLSRPGYWWNRISEDDELVENWPDLDEFYVFLEDRSQFAQRAEAREFVSDFRGLHGRRYVSRLSCTGVTYSPSVRLAM